MPNRQKAGELFALVGALETKQLVERPLGVLIGEMFASQRGLGFLLTSAINLGQIDTIMAIALLLTVFAIACNALLMTFDRHLTHQMR